MADTREPDPIHGQRRETASNCQCQGCSVRGRGNLTCPYMSDRSAKPLKGEIHSGDKRNDANKRRINAAQPAHWAVSIAGHDREILLVVAFARCRAWDALPPLLQVENTGGGNR